MCIETTRPQYERDGRRFASNTTDKELSHIAPLLPPVKSGGRPATTRLSNPLSGDSIFL